MSEVQQQGRRSVAKGSSPLQKRVKNPQQLDTQMEDEQVKSGAKKSSVNPQNKSQQQQSQQMTNGEGGQRQIPFKGKANLSSAYSKKKETDEENTDLQLFEAFKNSTMPQFHGQAQQKFKSDLHQFYSEIKDSFSRFNIPHKKKYEDIMKLLDLMILESTSHIKNSLIFLRKELPKIFINKIKLFEDIALQFFNFKTINRDQILLNVELLEYICNNFENYIGSKVNQYQREIMLQEQNVVNQQKEYELLQNEKHKVDRERHKLAMELKLSETENRCLKDKISEFLKEKQMDSVNNKKLVESRLDKLIHENSQLQNQIVVLQLENEELQKQNRDLGSKIASYEEHQFDGLTAIPLNNPRSPKGSIKQITSLNSIKDIPSSPFMRTVKLLPINQNAQFNQQSSSQSPRRSSERLHKH